MISLSSIQIAALYVEENGPYSGLEDVEVWGISRDARLYAGPHPVVAHPPCERWGRYWSGGPSAKVRRIKGDDGGCFAAALNAVRTYGGVLEHPVDSAAYQAHALVSPPTRGGWWPADCIGWTCRVDQGQYGHKARKATWLYAVVKDRSSLPDLIWTRANGLAKCDAGYHSAEERQRMKAIELSNGVNRDAKRLTKRELVHTPEAFRDLLISIAIGSR